jgi:hypothetical protein
MNYANIVASGFSTQYIAGLFASLTLRAALRAFNALRAFFLLSQEWRQVN